LIFLFFRLDRGDIHLSQFRHVDEEDECEVDGEETPEVPLNAIAGLVDRAREKLDGETLMADEERLEPSERLQARNRIVLMGGPGQGKSTISLFLARIFRAAILTNQPSLKRDHGVRELVPEILKRAADEGISTSLPARFRDGTPAARGSGT
jgi:2-phosphoglycerate kinase